MFTRLVLAAIFCFIIFSVDAQKTKFFLYKVKKGETFRSIAASYSLSARFLADYNNLEYYEGKLTAKTLRIPKEAIPKKAVQVQDTAPTTSIAADTTPQVPVPVVAKSDTSTTPSKYSTSSDTTAAIKPVENKTVTSKLTKNLPVIIYLSASLILLVIAIVYYRFVNRK
ncbi:MAG TPA: LysM peptidoglycan-binding domain-containing protein [Segetibacter sp.]|jgi:murein DD-endopeptidase MepM/ murein hydrolase activator NlpD